MRKNNETVLITGASSGFGLEFVKLFSQDGYNLILVARHQNELERIAEAIRIKHPECFITVIAKDLSQPGSAEALYAEIKEKDLEVDVLINNAGFGTHGLFVATELEKEQKMMHLNILTLVELTKLCLKDMVRRNKGKILQLASTVSFMPVPKMAVYAASKAFVLSFTEALQEELKNTEVTMTALCPGAGDTEFFERANAEDTHIVQDTGLSDPAKVAKDGYDALMKGDKRIVSGTKNKIQAFMSNFVPDSLLAKGMAGMMDEK
ncbi:SDR family oxidoreductase [Porifericola rhodea]|uniref:SDR family NAD(P)-dependent oxidoreductase n=1 Tax=Porifericola rhodea TaxID=930972 RepID=UPI002666F82A|nr:SDR family oxidoreductase [Porifericola rhodea]WKN30168.1 SDR family oxidoreductase [Porifericola rhodea]